MKASTPQDLSNLPPVALGIAAATKFTGIGRSTLYRAIASGELRSFKLGRRRMVKVEDARKYIDQLASQTGGQADDQ